ncbi:hypothetical protein [Rhizobium cauense]|uniref:hypothetical protein n=1 Tax=Rhizobium cauense TaxID=1166683 RepID=UPI003B83201D
MKKHCKGVNLANNSIQQCLQKHQAEVSPTCTTTLGEVTNSIQQRRRHRPALPRYAARMRPGSATTWHPARRTSSIAWPGRQRSSARSVAKS